MKEDLQFWPEGWNSEEMNPLINRNHQHYVNTKRNK